MTHKTQCLPSFVKVIDRPGPDQQKLCDWGDITRYTLHIAYYTLHVTHYTLHITHYTLHIAHYTLHITRYTLNSLQVNTIDIMAAPAEHSGTGAVRGRR